MKKGIFCFGAILFTVIGFSQNVSLIDQVGTNNDVDIDQEATNQMGVAYFNKSNVIQNGGENYANIFQLGQNNSEVKQIGDDNTALVYQDGGDGWLASTTYGSAILQEIDISQQGKNNRATVNQWGEGQLATIVQSNGINSSIGNTIFTEQEGRLNSLTIEQQGDANYSRNFQGAYGVGGGFNLAETTQESFGLATATNVDGYLQVSEIDQFGGKNLADVTQIGDNQVSIILQDAVNNGAGGDPFSNEATIGQSGYNNLSMVHQEDGIGISANNTVKVTQGNVNPASAGNISNIMQTGANSATVFQLDF